MELKILMDSSKTERENVGMSDVKYCLLSVSQLQSFDLRDIREGVIGQLIERIRERYNPARPISVIPNGEGSYLVADGNHRLAAIRKLGIENVPCLVYPGNTDPYALAVENNMDEDVYAPFDLFDWLDIIGKLRAEGLTQLQIGEKIGWSRDLVKNYQRLIDGVGTNILDLAKQCQTGRVPKNGTNVPFFDFTEGWFRNSGLYDLEPKYQERLIKEFVVDKCNWNSDKVKREAAKYKQWQEWTRIATDKLVNRDDLPEVIRLIEADVFKTESQLMDKILDFNTKAQNKLIYGDCLIEMEKLDDASIDLVITDPPYGIDYSSNRSEYNDHITREKITGDISLPEALKLIDGALEILCRKTKQDAHFYIFTSWKVYPEFKTVVEKYFTIKNLIIWDKGNHGPGDLEGSWANRYEMIIFATKGDKKLNIRRPDIIAINKVLLSKMIHPTQKPVELIKQLLEVSARPKDTVIDPFMGSGSTIKAVKEHGNLYYIGIELDKRYFDKAAAFVLG